MPLNAGYTYAGRVPSEARGLAVPAWMARRYPHSTEAVWRARIAAGQVTVDGAPASEEQVLAGGERLAWSRPPWEEPAAPLDWALLYRDRDLLAAAKPSGLPVLPAGGFLEHTLLARVRRRYRGATPLHRLGRGTSGLVLFARTPEAAAALSEAWRRGEVEKHYRALASGRPEHETFTIETPIGPVPHAVLGTVHGASAGGRAARSRVRVLAPRPGGFLAGVVIETGRPHQIRIHLAAAGYPLLGDPLYAAGGRPAAGCTALPGDLGYRLHAAELAFRHPRTGEPVRIRCAPPPDLRLPGE